MCFSCNNKEVTSFLVTVIVIIVEESKGSRCSHSFEHAPLDYKNKELKIKSVKNRSNKVNYSRKF